MDNLCKVMMASAAFLLFFVSNNFGVGVGVGVGVANDDETSQIPTNIIDAAKRFCSLPTASHSWFLPPNLDFRAAGGGDDEGEDATTKFKDAVVKSLDKSRSTVQDSAKSAANKLKHKLSQPRV